MYMKLVSPNYAVRSLSLLPPEYVVRQEGNVFSLFASEKRERGKGVVPRPGTLPPPGQDRGTFPPMARAGVPPPPPDSARTVVRRGRYASCVHAGGLS